MEKVHRLLCLRSQEVEGMTLEVIGFLIVLSHFAVIGCILLWFGLGKPMSWHKFVAQFKRQFLGIETKVSH